MKQVIGGIMDGDGVKLTNLERRIISVLSDGEPHSRDELQECLDDDQSDDQTIKVHIANIRKKIRPTGKDIYCSREGSPPIYRLIRLIASPNDGRI